MKKMADENSFTLTLREGLRARLDRLKHIEDRAIGWLINEILEEHLPAREIKNGIQPPPSKKKKL